MILSGLELKSKLIENYKLEFEEIEKKLKDKKKNLYDFKIVILANDMDEGAKIYLKSIKNTFKNFKINYEIVTFSKENGNYGDEKYKELIDKYNKESSFKGIFVQMPMLGVDNREKTIDLIDPDKDIEGITKTSFANIFYKNESIVPPTANAVIELANYYNIDFKSKNVILINRSFIIGKPLIGLLLNRDATITVCHSKTDKIDSYINMADILITAVGKPNFITSNNIKKDNLIIFDLAINKYEGKIVGDCDFENLKDRASITPVPNGIGPITNLMLVKNYINILKNEL